MNDGIRFLIQILKNIPKIENQVLALGFGVSCIGLAFLADWLGTGVLQVKMHLLMHLMLMVITTTVMVMIITTVMMMN